MISMASSTTSTACLNDSTSKSPSMVRKHIRLSDAKLQAVSSKNMYSEHGFEALIRALFRQVCQSLMVVSNCSPGSPHRCAASEISRISSLARKVSIGRPSFTARVVQEASVATAFMNSSVTRTELFEFWKKMEEYASPLKD